MFLSRPVMRLSMPMTWVRSSSLMKRSAEVRAEEAYGAEFN